MHPAEIVVGPGYQPENVFLAANELPDDVRRVAVLPLMADKQTSALISGREALDPFLMSELLKTRKFEVVRVPPEILRVHTGRGGWTSEDALPDNLFAALKESSGCDAVLFSQLTTYRAYAPMAIGWRMTLVDVRSRRIIWAGDEVFDAGQTAIMNGARRYQLEQLKSLEGGKWTMENSPRYFGQYTIARLLDTLPAR